MVNGILSLGPCYLITLTFRQGRNGTQRDADSVARVWKAFLRTLKYRKSNKQIAWFRVIEATKKSQPHLHLIVGGLGERVACCRPGTTRRPCAHHWKRERVLEDCKRDCLEHEWSRAWFDATGDSWVVNAKRIVGPEGAAAYLAKYLTKAVRQRNVLEALGFSRRWSRSRNWPGGEQMELKATKDGRWVATAFVYRGAPMWERFEENARISSGSLLMQRTGTELADKLGKRRRKRALLGKVKGYQNAFIRQAYERQGGQ